MSNEKRLPLKTILKNLEDIANEVRTDPSSCENIKQELKGCGYDCEELNEQVIKVLAVAVNEAIRTKVNLSGENKEAVKAELHQLLDDDKHVSSVRYFKVSLPNGLASMSSPLDMAKHLRKNAPQWLVKSIIQHQFDIRWRNGDPADYTYYQFCDYKNTTELLKYIPRQAHVKATLYKECRGKSVNSLRGITKENLCPTVYIRTAGVWKSWRADKDEFNDVEDINNQLSWIKPSIRTFITENADEQSREVESLKKSLEKPTLYWAVLDDSDFIPGEKLKLKETGRTQVYVGRANNGIQGRWLKDSDNHCKMMKKCLDNVCAMTTYDPLRLEGIQLVDARLTLAKVRREKTALFVIKTFGDDVEKAEIAEEKAEASLCEAKISLDRAITKMKRQPITGHIAMANSRREVAKRQEELDQAIIVTEYSKNLTKSEAESHLSAAEKLHRDGKVNSRKNIILSNDNKFKWKPKDMGYGMNAY